MSVLCSVAAVVLSGLLADPAGSASTSPAVASSRPATTGPLAYYVITSYGAVGDGQTKNTRPIQKAIDAANEAGGGTVFFPPGVYLSGTLYLRNKVTLELSPGATLLGSTDLTDYPSDEAAFRSYTDNYVHQSLIAGENLRDIAIVGRGVIKGQGSDRAFAPSGPDHGYRRRPYLIRFVSCRDVLVEGVTLRDSAMWVQHYLACDNLTIRDVKVRSRVNANNDGIDVDCCRNVMISDCDISSDDDALVLKSTADRPCENVVITNCILSSRCNGLKMGTETNGGFKNVTITNCALYDVDLAGLTLQIVDGGVLDRITVSNLTMHNVGSPVFLRLGNRARPFKNGTPQPGIGRLGNVVISNIVATGCSPIGSGIVGLPEHPIENVILSNLRFTYAGGIRSDKLRYDVPEKPDSYPEHKMFGNLPAYGFYCRHVSGLTLRDIDVRWEKPDQRPAMVFDDVQDLSLNGLRAQGAPDARATIAMNRVQGALIGGCAAPAQTTTFARLEEGCERISFIGNDLSGSAKPFEFADPSLAKVVFESANGPSQTSPASAPATTPASR
jgi:polygalacturonase